MKTKVFEDTDCFYIIDQSSEEILASAERTREPSRSLDKEFKKWLAECHDRHDREHTFSNPLPNPSDPKNVYW